MNSTVDEAEVAKFQAMADAWWDPQGAFKPLHMLNPTRLDYITTQIAAEFGRDLKGEMPFNGLKILDVGCGGGLLTEPMARLGAEVVGIDAAEKNIEIAKLHATQSGLTIDYRATTAEELAEEGARFDVILTIEVIEHVREPLVLLGACESMLKDGGLLICSTLNRTPKSFMLAVVGAERIMRWLPVGTHDWRKFITPEELYAYLRDADLIPVDKKGFVFDPLRWTWSVSADDLAVNYITSSTKLSAASSR